MGNLPPYWRPESEADIQHAIASDCLTETPYLDCKREVSAKADRKETARDMASFAIDGGALLIGVDEDKASRTFALAPQPLAGLTERVEDIAWSTIDPRLDVIPHEIESESDSALGYLFVEVRPSPFAPHMVDGVYYGRGEKSRIRLTDPQVRRYHTQRQWVEDQIHALLDEEIARDPIPASARKLGHLYLVAYPLTAPRNVARNLVRQANVAELRDLARASESRLGGWAQLSPPVSEVDQVQRRAHGVALCSLAASGPGRTMRTDYAHEDEFVDIEFREDGSVRALMGKATCAVNPDYLVISDWLIVIYAIRLCGWAAALGQAIDYRGTWGIGLHASNLRDLPGVTAAQGFTQAPRFDDECHRVVIIATLADLEDRWRHVAGELVGELLHALGAPQSFAQLVDI